MLDNGQVFDIMHKQMSISICLLFKLSVTHVTLVNNSGTPHVSTLHERTQVSPS